MNIFGYIYYHCSSAHQLSTVQNMDKILVISHGRVTEQGTHSQLLAQQGLFVKLWSMQAGSNY